MRERFLLDMNRVVITDATGTGQRMKTFSTRLGFRDLPHELPIGVRRDIYRRMRRHYFIPTILYSTLVLTPIVLIVSMGAISLLIWSWRDSGVHPLLQSAASMLLYGCFGVVILETIGFPTVRRWYRHAYTEAMLDHSLCPWCGYGLRGLPMGEDGNVMCPECTGKWVGPVSETESGGPD